MTRRQSRRQKEAEEQVVEEIVQAVVEVVAQTAEPVEQQMEKVTHHPKIYITPAEWGRIYAKAWQSKKFKRAFEENPIAAIRAKFPEIEFELVYKVPVRPRSITDDQVKRLANGEEIVFPNVPIGPLVYYHG